VADLVVYFFGAGNSVGYFQAQEFAIALAQAMYGYLDRPFTHAQFLSDLSEEPAGSPSSVAVADKAALAGKVIV